MRFYLIAALLLVSTWAPQGIAPVYGEPKGAESDPSQVCPVTGRPIDRSVSIEYNGARLYFAAAKYIAVFQADPRDTRSTPIINWRRPTRRSRLPVRSRARV